MSMVCVLFFQGFFDPSQGFFNGLIFVGMSRQVRQLCTFCLHAAPRVACLITALSLSACRLATVASHVWTHLPAGLLLSLGKGRQ